MSQPIRYGLADDHLGRIFPKDDGHLVMHSDYAPIAAENERLKFEVECLKRSYEFMKKEASSRMSEVLRIEDENERLRKAGDQMLGTMLWAASKNPDGPAEKRILAWINARDGNEEAAK